jgi:hypothetical protein
VWLTTSAHVTVSASYFHDAQLWFDTGGGQGYGLVAGQWTTASKIEDNSFWGMRHSMMVRSFLFWATCRNPVTTHPYFLNATEDNSTGPHTLSTQVSISIDHQGAQAQQGEQHKI